MSLEHTPENDTSAKPSLKDDVLFGAQTDHTGQMAELTQKTELH
jgi:hypothetical protein